MKNEQIKALVKEAIEEDRKERSKQKATAILESFLMGSLGALGFIAAMSIIMQIILTQPQATFSAAFVFGAVTIVDILFIYHLVRWNYKTNQEIESLNENRLSR